MQWFTKTGAESKTKTVPPYFDYMSKVRKAQEKERERLAAWRKQMKTTLNSDYSIGHADSKITIDGGENGSVRVDVPLIVNGRDILKELDEMRDSLLLLKRDVDMEKKYPGLREIKDEYERALAKYKTFDAIKESK
jgi:hypothetical protein